jgi:hypothetical protein
MDSAVVDDLRFFVSQAQQMLNRPLLTSNGLQGGFSLSFNHTTGLRFTAPEPDEEQFRSFMLDFRPFTMNSERIHLGRTMNLLEQYLSDTELRDAVREVRSQWKLAQRGMVGLVINERNYSADAVLSLFVNGYYFHHDSEKRELVESFGEIGKWLARRTFIDMVIDGVRVIAAIRNIILEAFTRSALR